MKLQDDPTTETEQTIVDATLAALNEVDPTKEVYPHDSIYFNTSDAKGSAIAILKFEFFPEIPATEFGQGKSSLQMKEEFEAELMSELPDDIKLERESRLVFSFYKN